MPRKCTQRSPSSSMLHALPAPSHHSMTVLLCGRNNRNIMPTYNYPRRSNSAVKALGEHWDTGCHPARSKQQQKPQQCPSHLSDKQSKLPARSFTFIGDEISLLSRDSKKKKASFYLQQYSTRWEELRGFSFSLQGEGGK